MKYRILFDGHKVAEAPASVKMTIDSKCPKKWAFVDMETGDVWVHKSRYRKRGKDKYHTFYRADQKALECLNRICSNEPYTSDTNIW